ncbi:hypothetical protein T484DRAFT_1646787, partial [Baffinella frigidus]
GLELRVMKRGARPDAGGQVVVFRCPVVKALKPVELLNQGQVRRVRGVAFAAKVSPQVPNRLVDAAKGVLLKVPTVAAQSPSLSRGGEAPALAFSCVPAFIIERCMCVRASAQPGQAPEEVGLNAAKLLLHEVRNGGTVDSANQGLVLMLAVLCPEDVSRVRLGKLAPQTVRLLRLLRDIFGVVYKIKADTETKTLVLSCMGVGYRNMAKGIA